jgi:hypothetical protein
MRSQIRLCIESFIPLEVSMIGSRRSRTSPRRWLQSMAIVALCASIAAPAFAQNSTATFNTLTDGGIGVRYVANCYVEANLRFTVVGDACGATDSFASWGPSESAFYSGSPALFNNSATGTAIDITAANGGQFSLFSISLAPYLGVLSGNTSVSFLGSLFGGGTVSRLMTLNGGTNAQSNFSFVNFTGLTSVRLTVTSPQSDPYVQFDNVSVNVATVVPEPRTVLLLGAGMFAVAAAYRRRRTA